MDPLLSRLVHRKTPLSSCVLTLLAVFFITPGWTGEFSVTPVRIFMAPNDRAIAVTVTNDGSDELVMQADLFLWKQKPGGHKIIGYVHFLLP